MGIGEPFPAAERGFRDGQLVLVHQAQDFVGVRHLGDGLPLLFAGFVVWEDFDGLARLVIGRRQEPQRGIEPGVVATVGDHNGAVGRSPAGHYNARTRLGRQSAHRQDRPGQQRQNTKKSMAIGSNSLHGILLIAVHGGCSTGGAAVRESDTSRTMLLIVRPGLRVNLVGMRGPSSGDSGT